MHKFFITIGNAREPRLHLEVYAENAQRAGEQADCLRIGDERVDVRPLPTEEEFEAADVQHAMHKADRYHLENDRRALDVQINGCGRWPW